MKERRKHKHSEHQVDEWAWLRSFLTALLGLLRGITTVVLPANKRFALMLWGGDAYTTCPSVPIAYGPSSLLD